MTWRESLTYAGWHWYTATFMAIGTAIWFGIFSVFATFFLMGTFLVTKHLFGVTPSALAMIAFATITYSAVLAWVLHRIYIATEDEVA